MEDLTIFLLIATLIAFAVGLRIRDIRVYVMSLALSVCSIGQSFRDATVTPEQTVFTLLPAIVVLIFTGLSMMDDHSERKR